MKADLHTSKNNSRNYSKKNATMNMARLVVVAALVLMASMQAKAQADVSPDHFDYQYEGKVTSQQASVPNQQIHPAIAKQQAVLLTYAAQIKAASAKVEAAMQDLASNGDTAGKAAVLASQLRQLQLLQASLAPQIQMTERTIAEIQARLDSMNARAEKPALVRMARTR